MFTQNIRVSWGGEAHKLNDLLNQVILSKEYYMNTCPISDIIKVMGVESAGASDALFHNCHKCLYVNVLSD
jgi:hypothetical protein